MDVQVIFIEGDTFIERRIDTTGSGICNALEDEDITFYDSYIDNEDDTNIVFIVGKNSMKKLAIKMDTNIEPIDLTLETFHRMCSRMNISSIV